MVRVECILSGASSNLSLPPTGDDNDHVITPPSPEVGTARLDTDEVHLRLVEESNGTGRKMLTVTFPGLCTVLIRSGKAMQHGVKSPAG